MRVRRLGFVVGAAAVAMGELSVVGVMSCGGGRPPGGPPTPAPVAEGCMEMLDGGANVRRRPDGGYGQFEDAASAIEGFHICYDRTLRDHREVQVCVIFKADVSSDGTVTDVRLHDQRGLPDALIDCLNDVVRATPFPPPSNGTTRTITVPINLHMGPSDPRPAGRWSGKAPPPAGGR